MQLLWQVVTSLGCFFVPRDDTTTDCFKYFYFYLLYKQVYLEIIFLYLRCLKIHAPVLREAYCLRKASLLICMAIKQYPRCYQTAYKNRATRQLGNNYKSLECWTRKLMQRFFMKTFPSSSNCFYRLWFWILSFFS